MTFAHSLLLPSAGCAGAYAKQATKINSSSRGMAVQKAGFYRKGGLGRKYWHAKAKKGVSCFRTLLTTGQEKALTCLLEAVVCVKQSISAHIATSW